MSLDSKCLDHYWLQARNLKSYHDLLKFIETLPDSKSRDKLEESVEQMLQQSEGPVTIMVNDTPQIAEQIVSQSNHTPLPRGAWVREGNHGINSTTGERRPYNVFVNAVRILD
jgi:hypothetical protein